MKEMFAPEKCPKCGKTTDVEDYATGWRCVCSCGWFGVFHFDALRLNSMAMKHKSRCFLYGHSA